MTEASAGSPPGDRRVATGIPGLDRILGGGFMAGSIYIVQGSPGTGKTIFSNQVCFHHVATGGKAVFVTLLAENHARMLENIGGLSFYDAARVPKSMRYLSAFVELRDAGLDGLVQLLRREISRTRISMLVIDGLVSVQASAAREQDFKMFIHDLQEIALATGCTMILTTNAHSGLSPEQTMVDGLISLTDSLYGWRAESDLQVRKFRGSGFLRGRHSYQITDDGIIVYPRLEAMFAQSAPPVFEPAGRLSSGIKDLDEMLDGGLPAGSNTAMFGPSGIGKTTLGLQFLSGSTAAGPGLFVGFYEHPEALLAKADSIGQPLRGLVANGSAEIMWQAPTRDPLDAYGDRILAAVDRRRVRRLVIDGITAFKGISVDPARIDGFFSALVNELRRRNVTTMFSVEVPNLDSPVTHLPMDDISSLAENIILLRHREDLQRTYRLVSILKMRNCDFDPAIRMFAITDTGLVIARDSAGTPTKAPRSEAGARPAGQADGPSREES